jgi:hypothetical protein
MGEYGLDMRVCLEWMNKPATRQQVWLLGLRKGEGSMRFDQGSLGALAQEDGLLV